MLASCLHLLRQVWRWVSRNGRPKRARLAAVIQRLTSCSEEERARAAIVLGLMECRPWEVVPPLCVALSDPGAEVRRHAVEALGYIAAPETYEALERCLCDPDTLVRRLAARALARIDHRLRGEDRRQSSRVKVRIPTVYRTEGTRQRHEAVVLDLSRDGLLLRARGVERGTLLRLLLSPSGTRSVSCTARVVRAGKNGLGCAILEPDRRLDRLVRESVQ